MKKNKKIKYIRLGILAVFLLFMMVSAYLHQQKGTYKVASIHALCPYGGLESLYSWLSSGDLVKKIFEGTMVLFFVTFGLSILFRRSFCGLLCPFGAVQEFTAKIGKKIMGKNFVVPAKLDKYLRDLKYVVLVITIFYAWTTAGLWMSPYDPWSAFAHLSSGFSELWEEAPIGLILLLVTLIGSFIYDRFFCKYLCPMGGFLGITSKLSPFKIKRNEKKCIDCNLCTKACPVNIDVAKESEVNSAECINCQECVLSCPKKGALENKFRDKVIKPSNVLILVISIFFGSILFAQAIGIYQVKNPPVKKGDLVEEEGGGIDTASIKGSMTLEELAKGMDVSVDELYIILGIPDDLDSGLKLKEIQEEVDGMSPHVIREILGG